MSELDGTELIDWRALPPDQRRGWWEQLWAAAIDLAHRYRLALRAGWWEDAVQVEALAAFAGWLRLYDTGAYNDPPGKLQLLWELERLRVVLRAGEQPFDPSQDRPAFTRYLDRLEHPAEPREGVRGAQSRPARRQLAQELTAVSQRRTELRARFHILTTDGEDRRHRDGSPASQAGQDAAELERAIRELDEHERALRHQLEEL